MFGQQPRPQMHADRLDSGYRSQARRYRSKQQRPCDLCRQRKTQCKIPESGGACELCERLAHSCTFVLQPLSKKRGRPPETQSDSVQQSGILPEFDACNSESMAIDVGNFENRELQFNVDVDSQIPVSDQLSFLGQRSEAQNGGAVDWSYLSFPISEKIDCSSSVVRVTNPVKQLLLTTIMIFQAGYQQPVMAHLRDCSCFKPGQSKYMNSVRSNFRLMGRVPKQVMKIQRRYERWCPKIYHWKDTH